jgi:hypothetical protein
MSKAKAKTVATRLTMHELAKTYDGLIARGINPEQLRTPSSILRTCCLLAITNCDDPKGPPSHEAINFFKQLWNESKTTKAISLSEILDK